MTVVTQERMTVVTQERMTVSFRKSPDGNRGVAALKADRVTRRGTSEHIISIKLCISCNVNASM